jgi:methionine-gamma-lyase
MSRDDELSLRTRAVHAGESRAGDARPVVTPIYQSTAFATDEAAVSTQRHADGLPSYSRDRFPNARELEEAVAALEGAEAGCATSSGMAAISMLLLTFLRAGDHVLLAEGSYCDTGDVLDQVFQKFDVKVSLVDVRDIDAVERAITLRTRLLLAETIANPSIVVPDLDRLAGIAGRHGVLLCVDNTFATPVLCRPLEHGADLVIHSATKFLGGHHDLTSGVIVGSHALVEEVWKTAYLIGATPGAMDAWLAVRGIRTLAPRMAWISKAAEDVARSIGNHPALEEVRYPALFIGEEAAVASRMLPDGAGGMLTIRVTGGDAAAEEVIRRLKLISYVPSLGGAGSSVSFPPRTLRERENPRTGEGWLRFSIGLESADDLIADITQALDAIQ